MSKPYFEFRAEPSPSCKRGRHDRCAAYDHMVVRCTCRCHGKASSAHADWLALLEPRRRNLDLRNGRTLAEIAEAETGLGRSLPQTLVWFFQQTDGFTDLGAQHECAWSLSRLLEENLAMRGPDGLPVTLVGFGDDGAGGWFCLVTDTKDPPVVHYSWSDGAAVSIAPGLRMFWPGWLDGDIRV